MSVEEDFRYRCQDPSDIQCASTCIGLEACQECACAVIVSDGGGPWGDAMDLIFCLMPILFLVIVTIKSNPMPTTKSLPTAALLMYLVRLMYLGSDPVLTNAAVILGIHEAVTPLSIMAGAIALFESMEATYCLPYMMREMKALTAGHPIAESMLIFCFAYMVEGASGFGTPVALGAPMLVSTGHGKMESVVLLLLMNTFATVWGAAGTPIWFGFGGIVTEEEYTEISYKAGVALCIGSFLLIPMILTVLVPWDLVKKNLIFIYASLGTVIGPSLALSFVAYEFPSLIGGMIGCGGTAFLISKNFGLSEVQPGDLPGQHNSADDGVVAGNSVVDVSGEGELSKEAKLVPEPEGNEEQTEKHDAEPEENNTHASSDSENKEMDGSTTPGADDKGIADKAEENVSPDLDNDKPAPETDDKIEPDTEKADSTISKKTRAVPTLVDPLEAHLGPRDKTGIAYIKEMVLRTFPIWGVVFLLVLTRVEQIGLKEVLIKREPSFSIYFGTYGTFKLSSSLVFQVTNILTYPGLGWKYELLYVPFLIPFTLVSLITMAMYRNDLKYGPGEIAKIVVSRLANPAIALFGALSLVQLLIRLDTVAPAFILGSVLANWFKQGFIVISPLLGALGSFFSGSTTVSNLTFGEIQKIAAESIGTSETTMLALQAVGGSAGNGICLNNIISACAVVGLSIGEGKILMQTYKYVFANTTIATIVMLAFFFRFE